MELRWMRAFVAVATELNYGRAAVLLHISQPAVSQQIRKLEQAVGTQLFERSSRAVRLTSAGTAFLPSCLETLRVADSAVRAALNAVDADQGVVRVGFAGGMASRAISALTGEVRRRFPGIDLQISASLHTAGVLEELAGNKLDLGFMAESRQMPGISTRLISAAALCAAVPLNHPAASLSQVALAALAEEPFVLIASKAALRLGDMAVEACLDVGFSPRVVQEAPDTFTMLALVGSGVGISVMPNPMFEMWSSGVAFVPLSDVDRRLRSVLAWRNTEGFGALLKVLEVAGELFPTPAINKQTL
ncbi:LysR substrate-binding domain-containing protein [Arthrobacter sp. GMC3]|uniref:LysR substrate-binding domain-containing protein n=1 Tax=Arthrobacter sp. GMC3 TaxID=2058894 RepID=UPI000CE3AA8F|nr:LysR substrate-binding domain-containing protein [Arthrobacter sp. GMC3]